MSIVEVVYIYNMEYSELGIMFDKQLLKKTNDDILVLCLR